MRVDGPLIVGAGLAGLAAALACAPRRVLVAGAGAWSEGAASAWAQGGLAAALAPDDSPALHAQDTVAAGAGLVDAAAALRLAEAGPAVVEALAALGAPFDRDAEGRFVQSLEAAHSRARVARVRGDQAGREIMRAVEAAARAAPHVEIWDRARVRSLLRDAEGRVVGALIERAGRLIEVRATSVVLATGGLGGLYAVTTNPSGLRGEGLALAAEVGAEILDPEFVQFHPTAVDLGLDPAPLATEALRGEGAVLVDAEGRPLMTGLHPLGDLAPRDVVARAVHAARESGRGALLDATRAVGARFPEAFPAVFAACLRGGVDPRSTPIPVAAAAHYHMGGIAAGADGTTGVEGLFAAGECAATGVHGANRLASNSLLEASAFGAAAGAAAREAPGGGAPLRSEPAPDLPPAALERLRRAMTAHAGVVRRAEGLERLLGLLDRLERTCGRAHPLVAARFVAQAALAREESRGGHFRADRPEARDPAVHTRLTLADLGRPGLPLAAE